MASTFHRLLRPNPGWTAALRLALLGGFAALTACGTLLPDNQYSLSRDVLDIKSSLAQMKELNATNNSKLQYSIDTVGKGLSDRNDQIKSTMDDIAKRINDQSGEVTQLKSKVEELSFALDALRKKMEMTSGSGGAMPGTDSGLGGVPAGIGSPPMNMTTPTPIPTPGTGMTPGTPSGTPAPAMTADQAFATGQRLFNTQKYKEARDAFRQALDLKPDAEKTIDAEFWLGEACREDKDYDAAIENYTKAIQANSSGPKAWVSLERIADIMAAKGDATNALKYYGQIVTVNPNYPDIARVKDKMARLGGGPAALPTPAPAPDTPSH